MAATVYKSNDTSTPLLDNTVGAFNQVHEAYDNTNTYNATIQVGIVPTQ